MAGVLKTRVVLHPNRNGEQRLVGTRLPRHLVRVRSRIEKAIKSGEIGMTSRLETYRVLAYNSSKQSENKIHDDAVARRFGFSGGRVPGGAGMAYLLALPGARWGG